MNLPGRDLPIWQVQQAIEDALREYQVVIVSAETGSGKSTQIPQMLLKAGYAETGIIGVTQPRRVAAALVARRIAFEQGVQTGQEVGFQVRFEDQVGPQTRIKVATEGIFLQEAKFDADFSRYSVLMLDEVHERSIDIDLLLGLAKLALERRKDFRVIVSSATVNIPALARFFQGQAKVIECEGRTFPIEHRFLETSPTHLFSDGRWGEARYGMAEFAADKASKIIKAGERGDILVFLAGFDDLERAKARFERSCPDGKVLLAYGEMPLEELETLIGVLMQPNGQGQQRVIFSTNVAETSVTPVGVTTVINSGEVKKDFCDPYTGITNIRLISTSRSSDQQRAGRAGRVGPGVCYHLFTQADYERHAEFDTPAIQRAHLGNAILTLASVGVRDFGGFPLLDQPDFRQIEQARQSLVRIGALDQFNALTDYGERLARFPLQPELAHLLIQAENEDAVGEMATFLAMYESRPVPKTKKGGQLPKYWQLIADCQSDPETYLRLWDQYYQSGFSWEWAKDSGLNPKRMAEARDIRAQLLQIATDQGIQISRSDCDLAKLKAALVKARLDQVCISSFVSHDYQSLIGDLERIFIHPSSLLFSRTPRLVWYFVAQTTTKLFAHCCFGLTADELAAFFPGRVKTEIKESFFRYSREVHVYEEIRFDDQIIEQRIIEEREMTASELALAASSDGGYALRVMTTEEKAAAEEEQAALEATMRRLQAEQNRRCHKAKKLLSEMPELPEDATSELVEQDRMIRNILGLVGITAFDLGRAENDLVVLRQMLVAHQDLKKVTEEQLVACQEELDLHVLVEMDKCPLCSSRDIAISNACRCVVYLPKEELRMNGSQERNLVSIVADNGDVLARIFIDSKDDWRGVKRVVSQVTRPFGKLEVIKT